LSDFSSGEADDSFPPGYALRHRVISSLLFETTTFIETSGTECTLTRLLIPENEINRQIHLVLKFQKVSQ